MTLNVSSSHIINILWLKLSTQVFVFSLSFQFLGLLHWALIAATPYMNQPVYGWVMFVAVSLWLLTIILFLVNLFSAQRYLPAVPWPLMVGTDEGGREEGKEQMEPCYEEKPCNLFCLQQKAAVA